MDQPTPSPKPKPVKIPKLKVPAPPKQKPKGWPIEKWKGLKTWTSAKGASMKLTELEEIFRYVEEAVTDAFVDYAIEHNIEPVGAEGKPDYRGIIEAKAKKLRAKDGDAG